MTTYYVSTSGNNGNSGTSTGAAWATIQYAVNTIAAGDVIRVLSGTYTEVVVISSSGTDGSEKTIEAYDSANRPVLKNPNLGGVQLRISASHWIVDGFIMQDFTGAGVRIENTSANLTNVTIQNCRIANGGWTYNPALDAVKPPSAHAIVVDANDPNDASYIYILNNEIISYTTGNTVTYNENITVHYNVHHVLIAGNYLKNVTYIALDTLTGDTPWWNASKGGISHHVIFRDNIIDTVYRSAHASTGAYVDGTNYVLIERNLIINSGGVYPSIECYRDKSPQDYNHHIIVRNNVVDNAGGLGNFGLYLGPDHYLAYTNYKQLYTEDVVAVHNTYTNRGGRSVANHAAVTWGFSRRVAVKNNVFYDPLNRQMTTLIKYDIGQNPTVNGWTLDYNLYKGASSELFGWSNGNGNSFSGYRSVSGQEGNSIVNTPIFTDTTNATLKNRDYRLTAASPGYGAGGPLTTATNSGSSSTTLIVADARYFCDGWGLQDGDTIYVGGTQATISNVNYDTRTITLASAISWSVGAAVGYVATPSMGVLAQVGDVSNASADAGPVTARAGADVTVTDTDGDGYVTVALSGAESTADATIVSYVWSGPGVSIAAGVTSSVTLPLGTHQITLTVTDNLSNTDTDTITITVRSVNDAPVQQPLVRNPCLTSADNWLMYSAGTTTWTPVSGGGYEIEVTDANGNTQLSQTGITVEAGTVYTLRLVATADTTPQTLSVSLFKDSVPYTNYGLNYSAAIGTTQTIVEYDFVATQTATDARLMIFFDTGEHVTINEFNLLRAGESGCYNENYTPVTGSGSMSVTSTDDYFSEAGSQFYEDNNPSYAGDYRTLYNNYDQFTGWVFVANTAIPDGAEITTATLKVTAGGYTGALPKLRVDIENAADPSKPTSAGDAAGRTWITGSAWQSVAWANTVQYTIDISTAAVQTLVNAQNGIDNGANIHLKLTDADVGFQTERLAVITTAAAELDIAWVAPVAGGTYAEESTTLRLGMNHGYRIGL